MTEKGKFLQKVNEAFVNYDIEFLSQNVTDDVKWTVIGDMSVEGKEAFVKALEDMKGGHAMDLKIDHIITHGNMASVNGTIEMDEGSGKKSNYAFCDVYLFSGFKNPKIKELTSYVIKVKD